MAMTGGDILVDVLLDWGVDTVFGLPGDGINGVMEALRQNAEHIRFVQVRHEEGAAFAACAYAKFTGRLGVCLATSGPGGIHLLNGLYDAKFDGQPVLAITGHHYHDLIDTFGQQDVDLDIVFKDACAYSARAMGPEHIENIADLAIRTALSFRRPTHVCIPTDFQDMPAKERSNRNKPHHASTAWAIRAGMPSPGDLEEAAQILNEGERVAIMAGRGALGCTDELLEIAEKLAAPIVKPLLGKACVPDDSPYTTGGIGLLGTRASQEAMESCDTLLIVGSSFPYIEFYPEIGRVRAIQIDADPQRIGLRYPVEVGLVADSRTALQLLLPLLARKEDRTFLERAQRAAAEWWQLMDERAARQDVPMKPQVIAAEISKRLPDNAIVVSDSGTNTTWWARHVRAKRGQMFSCSGNLATMACGLPYAVGAQVAYPDRPVIAFVGDGGFAMLMCEFITAVKYDLPIKVFVVKNNTLGQIKWEQMVFLGNPEYGCELQPIDFAAFARACGGTGFTVEDPAAAGEIVEQALAARGPVVVEAIVDPFEPPMPPRVTAEQAGHFAKSLLKGEPNRMKIAMTAISDKVRELV